ncbi:MAG TPA: lactate utilization protein B [Miltoncostaeaceae bacterium]|mgnify:CR=1 FL=1|nr:lactate utilization protein B [Miltoncostaeaceae bacterium]
MSAPGRRGDVVYRDTEGSLRDRSRAALADAELGANLRNASASWAAGRARIASQNPFAEMRERAREIRRGDIRDLPELLERLEANVRAAGGVVAYARDADAACRYIIGLAEERGAGLVAKSKSMATEEIKLNEALEAAGRRVVETDLGEWIIQLAGQHPSHIVAPAVHLNKEQVRELFAEESGAEVPHEREDLVAHARRRLREVFASADIGISGVNLAVADTGTICVVENEGNARLVTALPRVHVAVMGMERVVRDWEEAAHILQILPMAAIGDDAAGYVNLITGPRDDGEADGPEEFHLVILDGGRSALRGTDLEEALDCIRCGACLYSCPMWRSVGGQAYGSPYSGPIGSVLTPLLEGMEDDRSAEMPFMSSLCGACHDACPVGIPLHDLLVRVRNRAATPAQRRDRRRFQLWSRAWGNPVAYRASAAAARLGLRLMGRRGWIRRLPGPGADWTAQRDLPSRWPPAP